MALYRVALANLRFPSTPEASVALAEAGIARAAAAGARVVCFPECFVPGYQAAGKGVPPVAPASLDRARGRIGRAAARGGIAVILGTERPGEGRPVLTALIVAPDGSVAGFQDKIQLDPSEEATDTPGSGRRVFREGTLTFGVATCHEGWRYPETVRWSARNGAQVVFHPQSHEAEPGSYRPTTFADPANTFHEKAAFAAPPRIPALSPP